jgi:uncharacterized protein (TIRG00374 family)
MRIFRPLLRLVITGAILYLVYQRVPFSNVITALRVADLRYLAAACILVLCIHLLATWRLRLLLRQQDLMLPYRSLFAIVLESLFYRVSLPGGTIATTTARFLKLQKATQSRSRTLACLAIDRIFATLSLVTVGIVFALLNRKTLVDPVGAVLLVSALLILVFYVAAIRGTAGNLVVRILRTLRLWRLSELAERGLQPLTEFQKMRARTVFIIAGLSLGSHLVGMTIFTLLGTAVGIDIPLLSWGWIRSLVILAAMLPISLLGLGVREASLLYLLQGFGVPDELCLAMAMLIFSVSVLFVALLGGLLEVGRLVRRTR